MLSYHQKAILYHQLQNMEQAGLSAEQAFSVLLNDAIFSKTRINKRLQKLISLIKRGKDIVTAGKQVEIFNDFDSGVMKPLMMAGKTETAYQCLAKYYQLKGESRDQMKANLVYPLVLVILAILIMPIPQIFSGTISVLEYVWTAFLRIITVLSGLYLLWNYPLWKEQHTQIKWLDKLILAMPGLSTRTIRHNRQRFIEILGLLLDAGLAMDDAYLRAIDTCSNSIIKKDIKKYIIAVRQGKSLYQVVQQSPYLADPGLLQLLHTGEQSGRLPEMLLHYAKHEQKQITRSIQIMTEWIPRIAYLLIALMIAKNIIETGLPMPEL